MYYSEQRKCQKDIVIDNDQQNKLIIGNITTYLLATFEWFLCQDSILVTANGILPFLLTNMTLESWPILWCSCKFLTYVSSLRLPPDLSEQVPDTYER